VVRIAVVRLCGRQPQHRNAGSRFRNVLAGVPTTACGPVPFLSEGERERTPASSREDSRAR